MTREIEKLGNVGLVPLPNADGPAMIDAEDIPLVKGKNFCLAGRGYPATRGENAKVLLSRLVTNASDDVRIVRVNGNRLDCRKKNLRLVPMGDRFLKRRGSGSPSTSPVGVAHSRGKWFAHICHQSKSIYLGEYSDIKSAIVARLTAERLLNSLAKR